MKAIIITVFTLVLCSNVIWAKIDIKLQEERGGYTLDFEVGDYEIYNANTLGFRSTSAPGSDTYSRIRVPEYKYTDEVGKPELPVFIFHMAISKIDQVPTFEILHPVEEAVTLPHAAFPAQKPWPKSQPASERTFDMNEQYYKSHGEKRTLATVDEVFTIRGVPCVKIKVSPFSYDPLENKLTITKNFTINIKTSTAEKYQGLDSKVFEKYLRYILVNFDDAVETVGKRVKENYHIITPPEYETDLEEFISFRKIRFNVDVSTTDQTGTSASQIQTYIKGLDPTPAFLLLVGDVGDIPTGGSSCDLDYSDTQGDYHPEILLGRFSVSNSTDLGNIIRKTIFMETNLKTIEMKNIFTGGADAGNGQIAEGTHNYCINTYLDDAGYENTKYYCNSTSVSKSDVTASINGGLIFNIYSGHGNSGLWGAGDFSLSTSDVKSLTNTTSYPFMYGFACNTGEYSKSECFTEGTIRAENGGVTCVGSTVSSHWGGDDDIQRGMFDAVFDANNPQTSVAASLNAGKLNEGSEAYHKQYNLMGDPGLEVFPVDLAPFVTATSPNGGEDWEQGRTFAVTWEDNLDDNVKIELLKGTAVDTELAASVPSEGLFEWDIPADFPLGDDYKIRITCVTQDTLVDESDSAFAIEKKSNLELKLPNGGEYIEKESEVEITWDDNLDGNVNIDLYRQELFYVNIAASIQSNGSYTWKVAETIKSGMEYRIRIISDDKDWLYDESDADISIQNPVVKEFPYIQPFDDFDTGTVPLREYWEQCDGDDLNWTVWTGMTPTKYPDQGGATGPDNDHTSGNGNYLYVESSGSNNPDKKADFISPIFDLRFLQDGICTFWYHMFSDNEGNDEMGDLYVDINADGTWEEGILHFNGDKGDEWHSDSIDLKDYSNKKVQFRFRAVTGDGWASDICIDDFKLDGEAIEAVTITKNPEDQTVEETQTATFTVAAEGAAPISYQWQTSDGQGAFEDVTGATDLSYTTPELEPSDSGSLYRCIASNAANSDTSTAATLNVETIVEIVNVVNVHKDRFDIVPNPADRTGGKMNFSFLVENVKEAQLSVYDALGNEVFAAELADGEAQWDLTDNGRTVAGDQYLAVLWVTYTDGTIEQIRKSVGIK